MMLRNAFLYILGLFFLSAAKIKHMLHGYTSTKAIPITDYAKCVTYDIEVVNQWLQYLSEYTGDKNFVSGKRVLELGPGSDLGTGLYLLANGASNYAAIDVNNLVEKCPDDLYDTLFDTISKINLCVEIEFLRQQLKLQQQGNCDRLNFVKRSDFDISAAFSANSIDLVFSQAAFEHFDNIDRTIEHLSTVVRSGGIAILEIDLKTHTRWIRERDPLNIYRFSPFMASI